MEARYDSCWQTLGNSVEWGGAKMRNRRKTFIMYQEGAPSEISQTLSCVRYSGGTFWLSWSELCILCVQVLYLCSTFYCVWCVQSPCSTLGSFQLHVTRQPYLLCIQTPTSTPWHIRIYYGSSILFQPAQRPSPEVSKGYFLVKKICLVLVPGEKSIVPIILNFTKDPNANIQFY